MKINSNLKPIIVSTQRLKVNSKTGNDEIKTFTIRPYSRDERPSPYWKENAYNLSPLNNRVAGWSERFGNIPSENFRDESVKSIEIKNKWVKVEEAGIVGDTFLIVLVKK